MSKPPRDAHKSQVYRAGWKFQTELEKAGKLRQFDSLKAVQRWLDAICKRRWFQNRWPHVHRIIVDGHKGNRWSHAHSLTQTIRLATTARDAVIVLHEAAHLCAGLGNSEQFHGGEYVSALLTLVRHTIGRDEARRFKALLLAEGARVRKPRELTPEQKAKAAARFRKNVLAKKPRPTKAKQSRFSRYVIARAHDLKRATSLTFNQAINQAKAEWRAVEAAAPSIK